MIYSLYGLIKMSNENHTYINGRWVPARPLNGTFLFEKLRDAWEVFRGRADAFRWPEGQ